MSARVALATTLLSSTACGLSKPITNAEAAATIGQSEPFLRGKYLRVPRRITVTKRWTSAYGQEKLFTVSQLASIDPVVAILKLQRLVRVDESLYGPGMGATHLLVVTPTDLDSAALLPDPGRPMPTDQQAIEDRRAELPYVGYRYSMGEVKRDDAWRVLVGAREFVRVDKIHNWKDPNIEVPVNQLAVDFSWRWRPNELGDAFDSRSAAFESLPDSVQEAARSAGIRMNTGDLMHSRAYLERDRNGQWKLRLIEWSFGRGNPS